MRASVSAMLSLDFDVVALASDGEQALAAARRTDPDVVVLDITMPGLSGFQTARALARSETRAKIVFLSALDGDDYVAEAFASGGRGYVSKVRTPFDLPSALDHVLAGRTFVPTLSSLLDLPAARYGHAMQIYTDEQAFLDGIGDCFDQSLRRGDATCVIATEPVRRGLTERLRARGWSVDGASPHARVRVIDAAEALARVVRDGRPDPGGLAAIAAELEAYRDGAAEGSDRRLTVFGDMVFLLSTTGNGQAAIELERTWNTLTRARPFLTLCGYSRACFRDHNQPWLFDGACAEHTAVSHAHGTRW